MSTTPSQADLDKNEIFAATMRETRETLDRWGDEKTRVIGGWMIKSLVIALTMLLAVYIVSLLAEGTETYALPNILGKPHAADVIIVFFRNMLVLALHGFVCLAGFMAMRALPEQTKYKSGVNRWVHEHAGPAAMVFVSAATIFSMTTQVWILGHQVADLSYTLGVAQSTLMLTVLPHAVLELTAVFLPLAAFITASRAKLWDELLAATIVTVSVAIPMIIVAAILEAYLWPETLQRVIF
ncbi:MAG: stage II sporulation protein M [Thermoleophilaceae bacterium]|nr:stage II sporulation protein M [Thermoleophilaceae bacterium]